MKDLKTTQDLLKLNLTPGYFDNYISERERLVHKLSTSFKQPYLDAGKSLVQFMQEYAEIALKINPVIIEYNEILNKTISEHPADLREINEVANKLCGVYMTTNIRDLRKRVGVLKTRRHVWMKVDVPYRNNLYKGLDNAAQMLTDCIKMSKRKKRLDAKVSYPYWLW